MGELSLSFNQDGKDNVTRENKLAMGGEIRHDRVNKGNNIFCDEY